MVEIVDRSEVAGNIRGTKYAGVAAGVRSLQVGQVLKLAVARDDTATAYRNRLNTMVRPLLGNVPATRKYVFRVSKDSKFVIICYERRG